MNTPALTSVSAGDSYFIGNHQRIAGGIDIQFSKNNRNISEVLVFLSLKRFSGESALWDFPAWGAFYSLAAGRRGIFRRS